MGTKTNLLELLWAFRLYRNEGVEDAPAIVIQRAIELHEEDIDYLRTLLPKGTEVR